jgi:tripartite-type tricarboxylate transporter receptor subunit TctC
MRRRAAVTGLLGCLPAVARPSLAQAQSAPVLRLVVPYPAGGATDVQARMLAEPVGRLLGQTIVIDNRTGGAGVPGSDLVARAAPDGITLCYGTSQSHATVLGTLPNLPYRLPDDFKGIVLTARTPNIVAVHPSVPVRDTAGLVAYFRANPESSYGAASAGSSAHLAGVLMNQALGLRLDAATYRGGGGLLADLTAGHVKVGIADSIALLQPSRDGRVRAIAVTSAERLPAAPDLPTLAESGMTEMVGFDASAWQAVFAPAATPMPIVERLNRAFNAAITEPAVSERLRGLGAIIGPNTPAEFEAFWKSEITKWNDLIRSARIRFE